MRNQGAANQKAVFGQNYSEIDALLSEEMPFNPENKTQEFYKTFNRRFKDQLILKHGYKLFTLGNEEEDIVRYCMAILQSSAKFPLKVKFHTQNENARYSKHDVWIETQILMSNLTIDDSSKKVNCSFQKKIYLFFTEKLIPTVKKFKERRLTWEYMCSDQYTDSKVLDQFDELIIQKYNKQFRECCISGN